MASNSRRTFLQSTAAATGTALIGALAGCSGQGSSSDALQVAAVSVGDTSDYWNIGHESSIETVDDENGDVEITFQPNVAPGDAADTLRSYADQNYDLIYSVAVDFQEATERVSSDYPDIPFEHVAGSATAGNMGQNYARFYESCYIAGYVTALTLEDNGISDPLLGYVTAFPIGPTLRRINAFANGAYQANSDVEMEVNFVGEWYDPPTERQGAESLIDQGADVLYNGTNSGTIVSTASDNDVWSVGMYDSMANEAGDKYITSVIPNWDTMYEDSIMQIQEDNWSAGFTWNGFKYDWMELDDWGPNVPTAAQDTATDLRQQIIDGDLDPYTGTVYEGYHDDRDGEEINDNDQYLLTEVDEFVEPIRGSVD